jgi:hypothetical protein
MHLAFKLKIFGDDAFGKVSSRCKVAAKAVNHLLEVNTVFFPAGSIRAKIPLRVHPLNEETFKSAVVDLLKCTNDTSVQRFYVGDGDGNVEVAGLGIPPVALTDGVSPGAETLFKRSLHEVKALFESQTYLKNLNAAVAVAAQQQAALLEGINRVANGQPLAHATTEHNSITTDINNNSSSDNTPSAVEEDRDKKKRSSPAVSMAEASLLSQKAALLEQDNSKTMLTLQKEESQSRA